MNRQAYFVLIILLLFCSCREETADSTAGLPVVVEGWIESGGYPTVILSYPIDDIYGQYTDEELKNHILRWAKVTVSDGETSTILAGGADDNYFPPYTYTGTGIKGEAGKTYYLKVEYESGKTITAQTTIPAPVPLEGMKLEWKDDTTASLKAFFLDSCRLHNYYQFFVRKWGKENRYYPSVGGLIDNLSVNGLTTEVEKSGLADCQRITHQLWPGFHTFPTMTFSSLYSLSDTLMIKLARMDEVSYSYWKAYHETYDFGKGMAMFMSSDNMPTNIQGGLGYWCGYGISKWNVIVVADSVR